MLDGLKREAEVSLKYLLPAIPAFALSDTTFAYFSSSQLFSDACRTKKIGESSLDSVLKQSEGTLFSFKDLQLSITGVWNASSSSYVTTYSLTFQRPGEAAVMNPVNKTLPRYSYERSITTLRYKGLFSTWKEINRWMSQGCAGKALPPELVQAFRRFGVPVVAHLSTFSLDFQVISARGFLKKVNYISAMPC